MNTAQAETLTPNPDGPADPQRKRDLGRIHLLKKQCRLNDENYRLLVRRVTGAESSAQLDARERWKLILALEDLKRKARDQGQKLLNAPAERSPMLQKIYKLLEEAGRPLQYAEAMAKRMFKVEKLEWCDPSQLHKLVAALEYDKKRRLKEGKKDGPT